LLISSLRVSLSSCASVIFSSFTSDFIVVPCSDN
jgi:hypothetical protein